MASLSSAVTKQLSTAVYLMIHEVVAAGGAPRAYDSMRVLQETWNDNATALKNSGVAWFKLVEDGQYGPNTGKALKILTGVSTPTKTAGLPAWYDTNRALLESYATTQSASSVAAASQPAPWSPSDADLADVDALHGAVYLMLQEVAAAGGAARAYPSMLLLQQTWNASKATVNHFYSAGLLPKPWFKLVEDGKYGPDTSVVLSYSTSVAKVPLKTYDLVAWYATNKTLISGYAAAAERLVGDHGGTAVSNAKAEPSPAQVIAAATTLAQQASSGSLAREQIPVQNASSVPQGTLVEKSSSGTVASDAWSVADGSTVISSSVANRGTLLDNQTITPPQAIGSKIAVANEIAKIAPSVTAVDFSNESVIAQRPKSNLKVLAVGAGFLAALGVFGYMASRKPSRRYA